MSVKPQEVESRREFRKINMLTSLKTVMNENTADYDPDVNVGRIVLIPDKYLDPSYTDVEVGGHPCVCVKEIGKFVFIVTGVSNRVAIRYSGRGYIPGRTIMINPSECNGLSVDTVFRGQNWKISKRLWDLCSIDRTIGQLSEDLTDEVVRIFA